MSVNAYLKQLVGTAISWKSTGGDYALTLTSLTNSSARQGAKGDLGSAFARRYAVLFTTAVGSAAANGLTVEVWWAASPHATAGTENPGAASGADAAFATSAEYKLQLLFVGALNLSNNAGTSVQKQVFELSPPTRYGMPVVVNLSGQSLSGTAADHEVRIVPIEEASTTTVTG